MFSFLWKEIEIIVNKFMLSAINQPNYTDLFGGNNDNSSVSGKKYYISKDNLAWGIMVPTDFKWALEYVNIKTVYSLFTDWVTSGGVKNQEWWKTFDSSKVYK